MHAVLWLTFECSLCRRTHLHDAALQGVRKSQDLLKKLPQRLMDTINKFAGSETEYSEYIRILRSRHDLCLRLGADEEAKSREDVEQAAKATTASLASYVESLSEADRCYLPALAQSCSLRTVPQCLHMAGQLLRKTSHEEIDEWKSDWDDALSGLVQITALMEQSMKDIEAAKKSRDRKRVREQQAEVKRQERETAKKLKADQKAALKAGALKLQGGTPEPEKATGPPRSVLGLKAELLKDVVTVSEADFQNLDAASKIKLLDAPLLVKDCVKAIQIIREDARVKAQVNMFQAQFVASTQAKTTGRCQLPVTAPDQIKVLETAFASLDPSQMKWTPNLPSTHALAPLAVPYIFGFSKDMVYVGGEDKWLGQLRLQMLGERLIVMGRFDQIAKEFGMKDPQLGDVAKAFTELTDERVKTFKGLSLFSARHKFGDMIYVPPGWLFAEWTRSTEAVIGVKMACGHASSLGALESVLAVKEKADPDGQLVKTMRAYRDFFSNKGT